MRATNWLLFYLTSRVTLLVNWGLAIIRIYQLFQMKMKKADDVKMACDKMR
jgi:hypothetical protein